MVATPADLDDYRAFRVAGAQGTRLARAMRYLARHPTGAFAEEVRAAFDDEEPKFFERAQGSRDAARSYLVDLPAGPHATAALALLTTLASTMRDAELADIARRSQIDNAKLETAAVQRRAIGEAVLRATGVLLDDATYGVPRVEASPALTGLMSGRAALTWGCVPARIETDFFFLLPTRPTHESRLLTLEVTLTERDRVVSTGTIAGSDLFVRWAEAGQITKLDPSAPEDRTEAQIFAMQHLGGALEHRFPAASCPDLRQERELYHRACGGWEVWVVPGNAAGAKDSILIRGSARHSAP